MDKKFLHKVVDQIISETRIDYDQKRVYTTFFSPSFPSSFFIPFSSSLSSSTSLFRKHCRDVYGLNYDEIEYVWKVYRGIIKDKIRNNL